MNFSIPSHISIWKWKDRRENYLCSRLFHQPSPGLHIFLHSPETTGWRFHGLTVCAAPPFSTWIWPTYSFQPLDFIMPSFVIEPFIIRYCFSFPTCCHKQHRLELRTHYWFECSGKKKKGGNCTRTLGWTSIHPSLQPQLLISFLQVVLCPLEFTQRSGGGIGGWDALPNSFPFFCTWSFLSAGSCFTVFFHFMYNCVCSSVLCCPCSGVGHLWTAGPSGLYLPPPDMTATPRLHLQLPPAATSCRFLSAICLSRVPCAALIGYTLACSFKV